MVFMLLVMSAFKLLTESNEKKFNLRGVKNKKISSYIEEMMCSSDLLKVKGQRRRSEKRKRVECRLCETHDVNIDSKEIIL